MQQLQNGSTLNRQQLVQYNWYMFSIILIKKYMNYFLFRFILGSLCLCWNCGNHLTNCLQQYRLPIITKRTFPSLK